MLPEKAIEEQREELSFSDDRQVAQFKTFTPSHLITTREAGNMSYSWGEEQTVRSNKAPVYDRIGVKREQVVHLFPEHGSKVNKVSEQDTEQPVRCDAVITETTGLALEIAPADCYTVLMFIDKKKVEHCSTLALIHLSRKNVKSGIIQDVVSEFASRNDYIQVAVAPGIRSCCFKFNLPRALFAAAKSLFPRFRPDDAIISSLISDFPSWTVTIDLESEIMERLVKAGILLDNISLSNECTACSTYWKGIQIIKEYPLFFSHKRAMENNEKEGRGLVIAQNK